MNDWFAFDLSGVQGRILSATLLIDNPYSGELGAGSVQFTTSDVSSLPALLAKRSDISVFTDLQSGTQYGQSTIGPETNGEAVSVSLDHDFAQASSSISVYVPSQAKDHRRTQAERRSAHEL